MEWYNFTKFLTTYLFLENKANAISSHLHSDPKPQASTHLPSAFTDLFLLINS